nr:hypothetical protein [Tanacetum cinerariifolium]
MHSFKDKLKEKLPIFFFYHHHSSSSSSSSCSSPSSVLSDHDQTGSPFKDESYLSSILSFFFPTTEPISSLKTNSLKTIKCEVSETSNTKNNNGDQDSGKSTSSSEMFEDAVDLKTPKKHPPDINLDSVFISPELYQFFYCCLPNIVKGCQWVLLYSTLKHGMSLRTLIRNTSDLSGPCLLITGDTKGAGTFQTFVFTTLYGTNRYFYMCLKDMLAFGGGGNFALRLDGDLLNGTSGPCNTFGNRCLAHNEEFEIKNVELWGFTHSSQYRS